LIEALTLQAEVIETCRT